MRRPKDCTHRRLASSARNELRSKKRDECARSCDRGRRYCWATDGDVNGGRYSAANGATNYGRGTGEPRGDSAHGATVRTLNKRHEGYTRYGNILNVGQKWKATTSSSWKAGARKNIRLHRGRSAIRSSANSSSNCLHRTEKRAEREHAFRADDHASGESRRHRQRISDPSLPEPLDAGPFPARRGDEKRIPCSL